MTVTARGAVLARALPARLRAPRIPYLRVPAWLRPNAAGAAALVGYLGLGSYLALVLHAYHGDAYSRVANAYYVLYSRDPHLGAMGFVWMPLPSAVELFLLPFKGLLPELATEGLAGVMMSAAFMALAVASFDGTLRDLGVKGARRAILDLGMALNPMVVYYGAIGTSEAPTIFFAVLTARYLLRYMRQPSTGSLVLVGLGLAGGYLTRYEAAAAGAGVAVSLLAFAWHRVRGPGRARILAGLADMAVALTPLTLAFAAWSGASWIITGSPFSQFTSDYGNSSQMAVWAAQGANEIGLPLGSTIEVATIRLLAISAVLPLAIVAAVVGLVARRDLRMLAVAGVFAPALGFMVVAYVAHVVAPWLRYFILVVPMSLLLLAVAAAPSTAAGPAEAAPSGSAGRRLPRMAGRAMRALALLVVVGSLPVAAAGMLDRTVAVEEARDIGALLGPDSASPDRGGAALRTFAGEGAVAAYLDDLHLPRGAVLLDVFSGFAIVVLSDNPGQFVATPDRDFKAALADPATFGVRYILAPTIAGNGVIDAVNRTYPNLSSLSDLATVDHRFPARGSGAAWTLYRVVTPG